MALETAVAETEGAMVLETAVAETEETAADAKPLPVAHTLA
jgi:hypothetical protein